MTKQDNLFKFDKQITCTTVHTTPHQGQKPGTSGLRKKVVEMQKDNYVENFIQSIINVIPESDRNDKPSCLVISGDGRYYNDIVIKKALRIACANNIEKVIIGEGGLLSTPAVSAYIRHLNSSEVNANCLGGIILTASHNPGGPSNDLGIKFNAVNGGPAIESVTNEIYKHTTELTSYKSTSDFTEFVDINLKGTFSFGNVDNSRKRFEVEVVSATGQYVNYMKQLYDFPKIQK